MMTCGLETSCPASALRGLCPPCWLRLTGQIRELQGQYTTLQRQYGDLQANINSCSSRLRHRRRKVPQTLPPRRRKLPPRRRRSAGSRRPSSSPSTATCCSGRALGDVPAGEGSDRQVGTEIGAVSAEQARGERLYTYCMSRRNFFGGRQLRVR